MDRNRFKTASPPGRGVAPPKPIIKPMQNTPQVSTVPVTEITQQLPQAVDKFDHMEQPKVQPYYDIANKKTSKKNYIFISAAFVTLLVLLFCGFLIWENHQSSNNTSKNKTYGVNSRYVLITNQANFQTVKSPTENVSKALFNPNLETYAFSDIAGGQKIYVTEQPQSKKFPTIQSETDSTAQLIGANVNFKTNNGTAYIKSDPGTGAQIVVAPVNNLLITLTSNLPLSTPAWTAYLNSLKASN